MVQLLLVFFFFYSEPPCLCDRHTVRHWEGTEKFYTLSGPPELFHPKLLLGTHQYFLVTGNNLCSFLWSLSLLWLLLWSLR